MVFNCFQTHANLAQSIGVCIFESIGHKLGHDDTEIDAGIGFEFDPVYLK